MTPEALKALRQHVAWLRPKMTLELRAADVAWLLEQQQLLDRVTAERDALRAQLTAGCPDLDDEADHAG